MKVFVLVAIVAFITSAASAADDDLPTIDAYEFTWTVYKDGGDVFQVEKTQDATTIWVGGNTEGYRLRPKEAPAIGDALKSTDDYWRKLKDSTVGVSQELDAGEYKVTFHNDPKYGFAVWLNDATNFYAPTLRLSREVAEAFTPLLEKAPSLAAAVDQKINP